MRGLKTALTPPNIYILIQHHASCFVRVNWQYPHWQCACNITFISVYLFVAFVFVRKNEKEKKPNTTQTQAQVRVKLCIFQTNTVPNEKIKKIHIFKYSMLTVFFFCCHFRLDAAHFYEGELVSYRITAKLVFFLLSNLVCVCVCLWFWYVKARVKRHMDSGQTHAWRPHYTRKMLRIYNLYMHVDIWSILYLIRARNTFLRLSRTELPAHCRNHRKLYAPYVHMNR